MRLARFGLLLFLWLFSISMWAQQLSAPQYTAQTPEQALQAAALIQQSLAAQNGGTQITDVTLTGSVVVTEGNTTESGTIVLTALATGQTKSILALPSGTRSSFRDYSVTPHVGKFIGPDGVSKDAAPHDLMGPHPAWYFPQFIMATALLAPGYSNVDLGQETRDGATVRHIAIWQNHGTTSALPTRALQQFEQRDFYLDPATLLPVTLTFSLIGTNPNTQVKRFRDIPMTTTEEIRFSDYRQVQGRLVAFHVRIYVHNTLVMEIQFSSFSINTGAVVAGL